MTFTAFPKIPRLSRNMIITEKLDGTNAQIVIGDDGSFAVGSRNQFITPQNDNYGFAGWAYRNQSELMKLGPGIHYGEWWGNGIQRTYGLKEKRFSLFNVSRWSDDAIRPACCGVVPLLYTGPFDTRVADEWVELLRKDGSRAVPGFMKPEGIVVFHVASGYLFKKTLEKDESPKGA